MTDDRCCATCINWHRSDAMPSFNGEAGGECHRYAPRPSLGSPESSSMVCWPLTRESETCGEWYFGRERVSVSAAVVEFDQVRPTTEMPIAEIIGDED